MAKIIEGSLCDTCEHQDMLPDCDGLESAVQEDGEVRECDAYESDESFDEGEEEEE
jgi:hypothetical protein